MEPEPSVAANGINAVQRAKRPQGFAAISPERRREIAAAGGRAAHARGTGHRFSPQEAADAGRRGGQSVARDRRHMQAIGRLGGTASGASKAARRASVMNVHDAIVVGEVRS